MIRKGTPEDKRGIFDNYKRSASAAECDMQYYFDELFNPENIYVQEANGHIMSSVQVDITPLMLNGKRLGASVMTAHFTSEKGKRYSDEMMQKVTEYQSHQTLVSLIATDDEKQYAPYGYETVYRRKLYSINRNDLSNASYQGVSKDFTLQILKDLYQRFSVNFDGYFIREDDYWKELTNILQIRHYNLAVFYNEELKPEGYMIYYLESARAIIRELVYLNGTALTRLLCYALHYKGTVHAYVSEMENLKRAFPKIRCKTVVQMVGKINDYELFNKLYESEVISIRQAFTMGKKALFGADICFEKQ